MRRTLAWIEEQDARRGGVALFDPILHVAFNPDDVALRHEMGHATAWFVLGEGLGPLRLRRRPDGLLQPSVLLAHRDEDQSLSAEYVDIYAEKLLAGEVAARKYLKMPMLLISIGDPRVAAAGPHWSPILVAAMCRRKEEDIAKVLSMAFRHHPNEWWDWLRVRLGRANERVEQCWATIDTLAKRLAESVPAVGEPQRVEWGTNLISWMYEEGLLPEKKVRHPIELIPKAHPGPCLTRIRRSVRERSGRQKGSRLVEWRLDSEMPDP